MTPTIARRTFSRIALGSALLLAVTCLPAQAQRSNKQDFWSSEAGAAKRPYTGTPKNESRNIRFVVVGDNTGVARDSIFDQAMTQINWLQPEFVINIGDLIEGYSHDRALLKSQWAKIDKSIKKLDMPFFFVPGNHDMGGDASLEVWREEKGSPYYAFKYKNVLFVALDSEDPPLYMPERFEKDFSAILDLNKTAPDEARAKLHDTIDAVAHATDAGFDGRYFGQARFSDAQVEFVRKALARSRDVRWTFFFMHKPGWGPNSGNFAKIEKMVADRPYTMIAGHTHYYAYQQRNGRDYITMATTGGMAQDGEAAGRMDHIGYVTVTDKGPHFANIKINGLLDKTGQSGQSSDGSQESRPY